MWFNKSVFYQIYPLGFCGAPTFNDGQTENRIQKISDFIPQMKKLSVDALYLCPVFESDNHGYDTRDYKTLDKRLGTNNDFKKVCDELHKNGIKIVLDGVFNHVGRGFYPFLDVIEKKWDSEYKDWFYINFDGNSNYNDGFWYEGWEGHFELVKLNLDNPAVADYLIGCVKEWVELFDIDGLRLDVAYCLNENFIRRLRYECDNMKKDFFLIGEMLHGDYNRLVNSEMLDSCTNYECYKGLFSSFNSNNMFEIAHSLLRQFGPENHTLYKGKHLFNFVDNHDVERIASILNNKDHLKPIYGLLFSMPGIPCVYYGSEWGAVGKKSDGDEALRPYFEQPVFNELSEFIATIAKIHQTEKALTDGSFKSLVLTNDQFIFEREFEGDRILVAINAKNEQYTAHFNANAGRAKDLISGEQHDFGGGSVLPPLSVQYWKVF